MGTYTFTCVACSTQRELPDVHGGRRTTCDDQCARVIMRERTRQWRAAKKAAAMAGKQCKQCSRPMPPDAHASRALCSKPCELRSRADRASERYRVRQQTLPVHGPRGQVCTCSECGVVFVGPVSTRFGANRRCADCVKLHRRERSRAHARRHRDRVNAAKKAWREDNPTYLAKWARANPEKVREYGIRRSQRRRHLKRANGPSEVFTYQEIFERDGWICGLCAKPVDRDLKWPDEGCATLDHVLPIALGGTHTRDNVQLAHWICNRTKGARASA